MFCTGCPESRIDTARIREFLIENGWNIVSDFRHADLILFRACGLTEYFEKWDVKIIQKVKSEKKKNAHFIVWGCLPLSNEAVLRRVYDGITFGEKETEVLNKIIEAQKPIQDIDANYLVPSTQIELNQMIDGTFYGSPTLSQFVQKRFDERMSIVKSRSSIFHIKVSTGCYGNCAFCSVRISRGLVRSKDIKQVLQEFKEGLHKGFKYFGLIGTDLGFYGQDQGVTLVNLLEEMMKEPGDYQIGLRNVNPYSFIGMFDDLQPLFSSRKIWFLGTSIESGSNKILKSMRRRYTIEEIKKCITSMNEKYPDIMLRTQIMVGFPGETEQDFQDSLRLLDELTFDWVEVYRYSKRPRTTAASMENQVPEHIQMERYNLLLNKAIKKIKHPVTTKDKIVTLTKHPLEVMKVVIHYIYNSIARKK